MSDWPANPFIYEINTAVWLTTLSQQANARITLQNVPDSAIDELVALHVDAVWLMGVWHRSKAVRASALNYIHEYQGALPDVTEDDVIGSAYAIGAYKVDKRLGGRRGLASFRRRLNERGIKLMLDFVPNHVAVDHAWVSQKPGYFVRGTLKDLKKRSGMFFRARDAWGRTLAVAHGRDPYFPGWIDTAQLDAFNPDYRKAALHTLLDIADRCDGVRCDMAMLMLNVVFKQTWGDDVDDSPEVEFWDEVITNVKALHPDFLFIGEVYWGLEFKLQQLGFDFTYDKLLYDRLLEGDVPKLLDHLRADIGFQSRSIRFIENHDEKRAAETLGTDRQRAAATIMCTLPGGKLLHDGQFTGNIIKMPVQINRAPYEPPNYDLYDFYKRLLAESHSAIYRHGHWQLMTIGATIEDNDTHENLIAYGWRTDAGDDYRLIVVNMADEKSQCLVNVGAWHGFDQHDWRLTDMLQGSHFYRKGHEMASDGLYVDLAPYESHIFRFEQIEFNAPIRETLRRT